MALDIRENNRSEGKSVETGRLRRLESEVERLRKRMYEAVAGEQSRLTSSQVLPVSRELDALIIEYYKEKAKQEVSYEEALRNP